MKKSEIGSGLTKTEKKFFDGIIYSKLKRQNFKKSLLKTQKYVLENDDFTLKPVLKEEYEERELNVWRLEISTSLLPIIESFKEIDDALQMKNCSFKLYKKERAYIIENSFQGKPKSKKITKTFHFMPNGLPIKTRKKEYKYRNKFEFSDYELIDEGPFRQVFTQIRGSKISYKGKIYNFRIKYKGFGPSKKTYWIEMLRFEKR